MKVKDVIYYIGIGLSVGFTLIVYAHNSFVTKDTVELIREDIHYIRTRVDNINNKLGE